MEVVIKSITTDNLTKYIAEFARVCYRRDEKESTADQDLNRCKQLWKDGHQTPFESINIDFLVEDVSRSLLAQITRYRHASFSVESQRYVNYKEDIKLIIPPSIRDICNPEREMVIYDNTFEDVINVLYRGLISQGIKPEDARCVLPNATPTRFRMVVNLREFFHIYEQRSSNHAQAEIKDLVEIMFKKLYNMVDKNSQELLDFMQANVKLSIKELLSIIESSSTKDAIISNIREKYKELF